MPVEGGDALISLQRYKCVAIAPRPGYYLSWWVLAVQFCQALLLMD